MRLKSSRKPNDGTCGEDKYCVQLYSRTASLVNEFCLDQRENNISDIDTAKHLVRHAVAPCHFATTSVTLIGDEGTSDETVVQFDPYRI